MANGMTLGAYTVKSEDDLDLGEEILATGVEASYTIAAGLTAVVNVDDYDYSCNNCILQWYCSMTLVQLQSYN